MGPVIDGALLDYLTPADVGGQHDEWPFSALLSDTADRSADVFLLDHSNARIIGDWQADLFSFAECAALDSQVPICRSNNKCTPSVRLRQIGESAMPREPIDDSHVRVLQPVLPA